MAHRRSSRFSPTNQRASVRKSLGGGKRRSRFRRRSRERERENTLSADEVTAASLSGNSPLYLAQVQCGPAHRGVAARRTYTDTRVVLTQERPMSDLYVYYFLRSHAPSGQSILSKRRATLEAIRGKGEPVMESQIVVDHTEVDDHGFLIGGVSNDAHPADDLWAQIRSLERRANSRDSQAPTTNESDESGDEYMLKLESRELRAQALTLKK